MTFDGKSSDLSDQPLLSVKNLRTEFRVAAGAFNAADSVSFSIYPSQTLALVGESGCGKSVTAMSIMRLILPPGYVAEGSVLYSGRDLLAFPEKRMRKIRGGKIAMIFQEPMSSLNPVFSIGEQIIEAIQLHQKVDFGIAMQIAEEALKRVGIADPGRRLRDYPHQMSGGMKQRVMIAMALACRPQMLIADEPTTALDVTIQAQILELLSELQRQTNMAIMLITHDLGIVAENADVVAIMYAGRIVEFANVYELFENPLHPYTRGLLACVPQFGNEHEILQTIPGVVPSPRDWPAGCRFEPRCTLCSEAGRRQCKAVMPPLREVRPGHWAACFDIAGFAAAPETEPRLAFKREGKPVASGVS